ncbi:MAG: thioredoxin domain-containing protein [Planctomycetaceae bacterium]|nr:thioredoxin domain-containing protein [Planctomycetaceae bacterium]
MTSPQNSQREPNRLAQESSPYLQQHALNPVDWYPWGPEAFEKARSENKPIFLSVGYSACHWCHVMERESFENETIAEFLNRSFVSIKVDREERPDVDQIYMAAVQLITRRGGWPMSVFMTAEGKPFFGGTYWPPTSQRGMPGFLEILHRLQDFWANKREEVDTSAERLVEAIQQISAPDYENVQLQEETLRAGMEAILSSADRKHGGFGMAPKFPHPMDIRVLLRGWKRFRKQEALETATFTLDKMAQGGLYDQLGGGFHRYSTDAYWLVPHFEKMLYDNALLVPAYLEAWQATKNGFYSTIVRETLDYVLREMTSKEGAFFATQDADSEGVEGKFFIWSEQEIDDLLGEDAQVFKACYDVTPGGNWEGHNILNRPRPFADVSKELGTDLAEMEETLSSCRQKLLAARQKRIHPGRDDKVLASWNGMMIAAMAMAGRVLNEPRYTAAAANAARFVLEQMRSPVGHLFHSYKDEQARFPAYLDDYACLVDGLVELFQAGGDPKMLLAAKELAVEMHARFEDGELGGFFYTAHDHEELIARTKDSQDNAVPSGNGMAATALVKLAHLLGNRSLMESAEKTLQSLSGLLAEHPRAASQSLIALDLLMGPVAEAVVVDRGDEQGAKLWEELNSRFLPDVLVLKWDNSEFPEELDPLLAGKLDAEESRAYLCEWGTCQAPIATGDELSDLLDSRGSSGTGSHPV